MKLMTVELSYHDRWGRLTRTDIIKEACLEIEGLKKEIRELKKDIAFAVQKLEKYHGS